MQLPIQTAIPQTVGCIPRPRPYTPEIYVTAVDRVLPRVLEWLKDGNGNENPDDVRSDLLNATRRGDDGYAIAKWLDRIYHWECDSQLVGILDDIPHILHTVHRELVERWVKEVGIKPRYAVGDALTVGARRKPNDIPELFTGFIASVDERYAQYTIRIPELGHVTKEEARGMTSATLGQIFSWEDVG